MLENLNLNGLDLDAINAMNEKRIKEMEESGQLSEDDWANCCFCGKRISIYRQNNPWPLENNFPEGTAQEEVDANWKVCCPECDKTKVMPARAKMR